MDRIFLKSELDGMSEEKSDQNSNEPEKVEKKKEFVNQKGK